MPTTSEALDELRDRVLAGQPLIFLQTWEEDRWAGELSELALELERGIVDWSITRGPQPPPDSQTAPGHDPLAFLGQVESYPPNHLFFVKDFHPYLEDPKVVRKLRDLAAVLPESGKTVLLIAPEVDVPVELRRVAVQCELPLPGPADMRAELAHVLDQVSGQGADFMQLDADDEERLVRAVLGLTVVEARHALARVLVGRDTLDDDVFTALVAEKRHMVEGSDLLEFHDLDEGVADVGGLDELKLWIRQRSRAYGSEAREQGLPTPKGVLLLGVQGCGKSLAARATARELSFPLIRLDVAALLTSLRGASEKNLRDVLNVLETMAPAVLWMDEIDKAFAGFDEEASADATMARILGTFLTWMQEHKSAVFVIATANSVSRLPPELLRRGRFDELFFVDLPNFQERRDIFVIHLERRGWRADKYDVDALANATAGYSGAEIEQIVNSAMLDAYGDERILEQSDLERSLEQTVPLSITMEDQIFAFREWARAHCRPATPDSRVMQMLDSEQRRGALGVDGDVRKEEWAKLADHGQLSSAVVTYIRDRDDVIIPQLQEVFAAYLPTEGDLGIALRSDPNVVLWMGLSPEFSELLAKLIANRRLYIHPLQESVFQSKEVAPVQLPTLDELPEERLARPYWYPTCLRNMPSDNHRGRFSRVARMQLRR